MKQQAVSLRAWAPWLVRRLSTPRAGFTLTELLVIMGTLALLAVIGLPSLANSHLKSSFAVCVSNHRQLIQSVHGFAQDNQDALVPIDYVRPDGGRMFLTGGGFWPGPAEEIVTGMTPQQALRAVQEGLRRGPLWQYIKATETFHCPGDERMLLRKPGNGWGYDSYSKSDNIGGNGGFNPAAAPFKRVVDVADPSMSFVFCEEADPRNYNLGAWVLSVNPPSWIDTFGAFHDGGTMFSFLDGHADFNRWRDSRVLKAATAAMQGIAAFNFPGGDATNPDFRWVWDRYQYLGWKSLK